MGTYRKLRMTQLFEDDSTVLPCTVVEAGPCPVCKSRQRTERRLQRTANRFRQRRAHRKSKADLGHPQGSGQDGAPPQAVREVRVDAATASSTEVGSTLLVGDIFEAGQTVDVTGISKGKGFQGVMKRYNFAGSSEATARTSSSVMVVRSVPPRHPGHVLKNPSVCRPHG